MSGKAVRIADYGTHGGQVTTGAASVLVEGRPVARAGDAHAEPPPRVGHGPQVIMGGSGRVFAEGRPVARDSDRLGCGAGLLASQDSVRVG